MRHDLVSRTPDNLCGFSTLGRYAQDGVRFDCAGKKYLVSIVRTGWRANVPMEQGRGFQAIGIDSYEIDCSIV